MPWTPPQSAERPPAPLERRGSDPAGFVPVPRRLARTATAPVTGDKPLWPSPTTTAFSMGSLGSLGSPPGASAGAGAAAASPGQPPAGLEADERVLRFLRVAGASPGAVSALVEHGRCASMERLLEVDRGEWDVLLSEGNTAGAAGERLWQQLCRARRGSLASSVDSSRRASACPSPEFEEVPDW